MKRAHLQMVLLGLSNLSVAFAETSVLLATGEWKPFSSKSMENNGIVTELVTLICKEANMSCKFEFLPWPRAEAAVEEGIAFAAFPYAFTDERKKRFNFSQPLFYGFSSFFYYVDNPKFKSNSPKTFELGLFKNYRFGLQRGNYIESYFKKENLNYELTTDIEAGFRKLKAQRIDFMYEEQTVGYDTIKTIFPEDLQKFKSLPNPNHPKSAN